MDERIVTNHELEADTFEKTIRPDSFDEYVGQTDVKEKRHLLILLQMNLEVILKQQVVLL